VNPTHIGKEEKGKKKEKSLPSPPLQPRILSDRTNPEGEGEKE